MKLSVNQLTECTDIRFLAYLKEKGFRDYMLDYEPNRLCGCGGGSWEGAQYVMQGGDWQSIKNGIGTDYSCTNCSGE